MCNHGVTFIPLDLKKSENNHDENLGAEFELKKTWEPERSEHDRMGRANCGCRVESAK